MFKMARLLKKVKLWLFINCRNIDLVLVDALALVAFSIFVRVVAAVAAVVKYDVIGDDVIWFCEELLTGVPTSLCCSIMGVIESSKTDDSGASTDCVISCIV